ncbi:Kae1-associated kinase Bud32 [Candidatus Woesearchaeota archaeon]|nr:Kae1-associated kinase Bud32 [Candidatus Woesearchaeota archaeon]|tara:strand:- start:12317 stop:12925 length:609 start_codon:yes stop_codon:yes gene_type:complete
MKLITEGAEASIFLDKDRIVKKRHKKSYRIKELDEKLRLFRTKREAKIMEKLRTIGVAVPKLISVKEKDTTIAMEYVNGKKVRDVLNNSNCAEIIEKIGIMVAMMHNNNIIHGDLTTSNMIKNSNKIYFVDFGLGFFSDKTEDKAVDLHLLKQALNSSHSKISDKCFAAVVKGYMKDNSDSSEVMKRLEKVENRGKYKGKKK